MRASSSVLLLQTLAEFSNVAWRKAGISINKIRRTLDAWCAVLPIQSAETEDLLMALEAVEFIDWRSGMRCCGRPLSVRVSSIC